MSTMAGVSLKAETVFPVVFVRGPCCTSFAFRLVCVCVSFFRPLSFVLNVAIVSGLSILDRLFGFFLLFIYGVRA